MITGHTHLQLRCHRTVRFNAKNGQCGVLPRYSLSEPGWYIIEGGQTSDGVDQSNWREALLSGGEMDFEEITGKAALFCRLVQEGLVVQDHFQGNRDTTYGWPCHAAPITGLHCCMSRTMCFPPNYRGILFCTTRHFGMPLPKAPIKARKWCRRRRNAVSDLWMQIHAECKTGIRCVFPASTDRRPSPWLGHIGRKHVARTLLQTIGLKASRPWSKPDG